MTSALQNIANPPPISDRIDEPVNFDWLIARMNDHRRIELEKRESNLWWIYRIGAIGLICFIVSSGLTAPIVWFLSTEGMQNIINILSGTIPGESLGDGLGKSGGGR